MLEQVRAELRAGLKRSHWMWFIFPQLAGLGSSAMAQTYAIGSLDEALAYLAHPVLGARLVECTGLVNAVEGRSAAQIFGSPDDLKFRSSMTLFKIAGFGLAPPAERVFADALQKYFAGASDRVTVEKLGLT